ncbi:hypothetical protein WISP_29589 [Willisornis vidua]|nr:hypothetical protein WISP_29589 [Willisornis vidua]
MWLVVKLDPSPLNYLGTRTPIPDAGARDPHTTLESSTILQGQGNAALHSQGIDETRESVELVTFEPVTFQKLFMTCLKQKQPEKSQTFLSSATTTFGSSAIVEAAQHRLVKRSAMGGMKQNSLGHSSELNKHSANVLRTE